MLSSIIGVLMLITTVASGCVLLAVLPWASEPGAPRGIILAPALAIVFSLIVAILMFFGG